MSASAFNLLPVHHNTRMKIGILGGSFNPAHEGHLHISTEAIKRLGLDWVIWFVTPRNPLKSAEMKFSLERRLSHAKQIAQHPKIVVVDYEKYLPNTYTITLIKRLKQMYPLASFCYLMGADNMLQLPKWHRWREIVNLIPIVVLDRDHHHNLLCSSKLRYVFGDPGERWQFIKIRKSSISSTQIRERGLW